MELNYQTDTELLIEIALQDLEEELGYSEERLELLELQGDVESYKIEQGFYKLAQARVLGLKAILTSMSNHASNKESVITVSTGGSPRIFKSAYRG